MSVLFSLIYKFLLFKLLLCFLIVSPLKFVRNLISRIINRFSGNFYIRIIICGFACIVFIIFVDSMNDSRHFHNQMHLHENTGESGYCQKQILYFRAQRNAYISAFSIIFDILVFRFAKLLSIDSPTNDDNPLNPDRVNTAKTVKTVNTIKTVNSIDDSVNKKEN